jgi:hypothetical protein
MTDEHEEAGTPHNANIAWERSDVRATAILKFAVGLLLATIAVLLLMFKLYQGFARFEASQQPPPPIMQTDPQRQPPLPRLQERPTRDITQLRANEKELLSRPGWVDESGGVVRIPIEEAMLLVAKRGLPVQGAQAAAPSPEPKGTHQ